MATSRLPLPYIEPDIFETLVAEFGFEPVFAPRPEEPAVDRVFPAAEAPVADTQSAAPVPTPGPDLLIDPVPGPEAAPAAPVATRVGGLPVPVMPPLAFPPIPAMPPMRAMLDSET